MIYWTRQSHSEFLRGGVSSALKNRDYKDFTDIVQEDANEISATRDPILQILWETYGEKAVQQWGIGMLELVQQTCILQQGMPESGLQKQTENRDELDCYSQVCKSIEGKRLLRDLRESRKNGCASYRPQPSEQCTGKSSETMQKLPQSNSQEEGNLLDLWCSAKRLDLLQQALHSFQEIRGSTGNYVPKKTGGACMEVKQRKYVLRRLLPVECARLQGFPDWWCDGVNGSDSAQYKMWGNGIALPCAYDVLGRIAEEINSHE